MLETLSQQLTITHRVLAWAHSYFWPDQNWEVIPEDDAISEARATGGGGRRGPSVFAGHNPKEAVLHEREWTGAFEEWLQDTPASIW